VLADEAAFDRAWQHGRALTPEQAIELASHDHPMPVTDPALRKAGGGDRA
jgi:hypothetical protein